jgi:hypothetical protein
MAETNIPTKRVSAKSLVGQRFGRWTVTAYEGRRNRTTYLTCTCDCGNVRSVQSGNLGNGASVSCGCYQKEQASAANTTHGYLLANGVTREYRIWSAMIQRCENPRCSGYAYYGGRGISVHPAFKSFEMFLCYMGECNGLTIERIDVNGNYAPGNVKWATHKEQMLNIRSNVKVVYEGRVIYITHAFKDSIASINVYYHRRKKGADAQTAFDEAVRHMKNRANHKTPAGE